jgi:hypothetical protein
VGADMLALYVMAILYGTVLGAAFMPTQKLNICIHTRFIAGFLQHSNLWNVQFGPHSQRYAIHTTILWPYCLLSGSEDNFGSACFHGLIQRNSYISGDVSACYAPSLRVQCKKYNRIFKTMLYKGEKTLIMIGQGCVF